jgi:choline-phosphate cytidylyltransferase
MCLFLIRSEEDNDPLTDDARSAVSVPNSHRLPGSHLRSSHSKHPVPTSRVSSARHQLAHNKVLSDSDGVDGDIESTKVNPDTGSSYRISHNYHLYQNSTSSVSTLGTPAASIVDPAMTEATLPNSGLVSVRLFQAD